VEVSLNPSFTEMHHRCYKLVEILGKIAIPLGKANFIETNLGQLNQGITAKA
jgi:hypothetical protein